MHRRDPRAKIAALMVFLVVLATAHRALPAFGLALVLLLSAALMWARLPLFGALARAAIVLPFSLLFAAICWLSGDPARAFSLLLKSYLSALAVLLVVSSTPFPALLRGIETMGAPRFLLMVAQFLYRYLFVISEEAQHMTIAAASRGATVRRFMAGARFRAAAGALAVLFARSYGRAEDIHRAMLARGFLGRFHPAGALRFRATDAVFTLFASLAPVLLRAAVERDL